tara:strand:- start:608 stop:13822 length:13215 start_codon:yes stop_codon:yes gene_type:complete
MIKKITILLLLLCTTIIFKAQALECNERIETNTTTPLIQVGDNKTVSSCAGLPNAVDIDIRDIVTLGINFNHPDFIDTPYLLEVDIEITTLSGPPPFSGTTFTIPLTIEYAPFDQQTFKDKDAFIFNNINEYQFEIVAIKVDGTSVTDLPSNAYIDGTILVNRIVDFTSFANTAVSMNPPTEINLDCDPSNIPEEIEITWQTITGALEYQLEWAFINDYEATVTANNPTTITNLSASTLNYDFKHNSTRINTKSTNYTLPLLFERGYLIYRVRAVGKDPLQLDKWIYGVWNANTTGNVGGLPTNQKFQTISHENLKNWQVTTNFAEEGKKKEVISYFDGSLRNRQSVTKINSDDNVIVGETVYDHQGRAAVSILPVPVLDENCPSPTTPPIKFYPNFNQNQNSTGYNKIDFDIDVADCETAVEPMLDASGASLYYSPNNPKQDAHQQFVPDAHDYPFTVIEYTPDNTGRIRRQSGVGEDFKLGSGHETKFFYGKPDQLQIDRLFSSEVGYASHYKKNMVIDANNQISVSYLDQEGRVIATALAGNPPTNVEPIPSQTSASVNLTQEMILPTAANTTAAGKVNQMIFNETFLVTTSGPYAFDYQMITASFEEACLPDMCFNCIYDLTIKLTDDCGVVLLDVATNDPIEFNQLVGNFTDNGNNTVTFNVDCNSPNYQKDIQFTAQLPVGNYNIVKTLTINEDAINFYLQEYLNPDNNTCIKTLEDFEDEFLAEIDTNDCNITCESCAQALGIKEDFVANNLGTAAEYDMMLEECLAPCKLLTMCETAYEMLLADVSPGGQYGQFLDANNNINVGMYWLSVYNTTVTNYYLQANTSYTSNWKYPKLFLNNTNQNIYVDEFGNESFIQVTPLPQGGYAPAVDPTYVGNIINNGGLLYIRPQYLANVGDFVGTYWQDSWAQSLVQYHPEYCYYQQCLGHMEEDNNNLSSELFDAQLRDFSFTDAVAAGYLSGDNINGYTFNFNADPFISFTGAANYNATAANELITAFNNSYVIDGQMRNMIEVAAYIQKCGNAGLTVTPSPLPCFSFGADVGPPLTPQEEAELKDFQWITLIALYLEKKNKIINTIYDQYAIQNCESFNDCIGSTSFNPFNKSFATTTNIFTSEYYNPQQACSYQRRALFKYKQKRFLDESDMGVDPNTIAYQMYAITGQCPVAFNFQNVLNELAATGNLTATNFNFNSLPSTSGLLIALSNNNPLLPFPQFTYDAALSGNTLKFITTSPNAASCETILTPVSGSFNWNDVLGFIGLDANGLNAPNYTFTVYAKVDDGNGGFTLEEINGETCMNILNCNFNRICSPNELAEDIQMLLSVIAIEGHLTSSSFLFGNNPNYAPFITANISNLLPNTANITWSLSPTFVGTFSDGTNTISLQFTGNPNNINPAQISFFNNINISSTGNNVFTIEAFDANGLNLGTISGTATVQAMGSSTELELGSCENPPLVDCETPAHQNLDDFFNLLKTEMLKNPFAINDLEDIMQSPAMTQGLISYFGTANNVTTTVNETIDCNVSPCLTTLELNVGDCEITMSFESADGLSFADFAQFENFTATGQLNNNVYYDFMFDAAYIDPNGVPQFILVNGSTTCVPLNNCETCIDSTQFASDPGNPNDTLGTGVGSGTRETDTTLALMPTLEAAVNDVNTRLSLTSTDSAFVETPTYNQIMHKGAGGFVQHYIRFIDNFNPAIDDSIYLHRFDMFIADFGKILSIDKEYKRYKKAVKIYNIRANNLSLDTLEIVSIDNYAANRLATGCNTYINHVDTCLQNNTSEAVNIMSFMVENNMIDTTSIDSNKLLYKTYVNAFEDFKTNHPLAKYAESYLKMASFQETEKNNLYFNAFAKAGFTAYINTFADTTQLPDILPFYDTKLLQFTRIEQRKCIQLYFQLVQLLNNYNNSSYAQLNNHQLPIPNEGLGIKMCDCLPSYMTYISPYLEVPANQNLTLPLPLKDPDCSVDVPCVEFDCKAVDPCKQAFKDYQAGVLAYNQMIADSNLTNAMITETYSAAEFEKRNLCACVPKFKETIGTIRDTTSAGGTISFPSTGAGINDSVAAGDIPPRELDLANICADLPCGPDSVSIDTVPEVTIPYVNPCVENMINTALANAANAYQQYIDSLSQEFITRYREHCTNYLNESFTKNYDDAEHHFTLYYYDQAGNLIKTIPPEGVDIVPTTNSSDNLSMRILADRSTNTKNFYTNHRMETKYIYNSLNQLTKQTLPDHDNMNLIAFQGVNGLPTNLHIEKAQFVTPSKGFLVGWINQLVGGTPKDRGLLYTTNNGGANWTRVNDVVAANINAMQWTTNNDAYAVGNNGVFLASKDGGFSWDMINLYTANVTENLNDLYLDASGNGLLVGDNLSIVNYQNGVPTKLTLSTSPAIFSSNATITAIDADVANSMYYLSVYDPTNGNNYVCYNTFTGASSSSAWTPIKDIRIDDLTAVSTIDNSAAVVAGNNGLLLKTTDNGANWIVTETNTRANFEHIYFKDANNGVAIINQHLWKTTNGGTTWSLMDASLSYNSLNLYENDGTTARLMAGCNGGRVVKVFINNNGIGHEPKFVDATPPVVTLNDAYAVPNGNNLIVVAVSNTDMYVTHNFNLTNPTWSKTDISTIAPNINQLRFVKGTGNHLMGLGIDNNGALFEFEYDPNKDIVAPIDSLLKITNPALSSFTDIQLLNNTANTFVLYNQTNNTMNHFTPTFGASAPTPTFGSFTNSSVSLSLPAPTSTRLFSVQSTTDNVLMIDLAGDINQLAATTYTATSTTTNVRVEKMNDVVVTQPANIAAVTNNGKMLSGNSNQLVLKITPTIANLNALDKVDVSNNTLMAGNNGSLVWWNGTNFTLQTTNTTNNLLAIDKQNTPATQALVVGESGTILYTSDYTLNNYTSLTTAESGSINTVKYNDNGKLIAGADFSHVLFGGNATVVPTKQVFTDRLTGVHFNSINNGTVVGKNYTVRSTNNSGTSFGIILPQGGFTSAIPMELNATFTANDRFIVGEQNYLGRASAALATTVTVPGTATNSLNDISINGNTGFIVGGDAANNAVAYKTTNGGSNWNNITINTPGTPSSANASINDASLLALHHFTNNNTFIAVGKDNTIINYNNANGATPTEITVLDINLGTAATVNLNDVDFYDNQLGYIVGNEGQLFRSDIVTWNNGTDLEIDNITWEGLSISDNIFTQPLDIEKDIYTIAVASRFNAFLGGDYDATNALQTYARLMRDETNEISSKFFYDRLGRLVISQNSKQFGCSPKKYSYTIYDVLGRIIQVGEKAENTANMTFTDIFGTNIGASYNPNVIDDAKLIAWLNEATGARTQVTQTYYDKQALGVAAILPATFTPNQDNFRNRVAMVCYEETLDNDTTTYNHATHYSYDIHGNVKTLLQDNKDLTANTSTASQRFKRLDYFYDLVSGNVNKVSYQTGESDQWHHKYSYDADNRIKEVLVSDNNLTWSNEARYFYYDHGPLARIELSDNNVQGTDYAYTLQGWLKNVNSDALYTANDMGQDATGTGANSLFAHDAVGFSLHYHNNDYQPIAAANFTNNSLPVSTLAGSDVFNNSFELFNGNIRAMVTTIKKPEIYTATTPSPTPNPLPQATAYKYDQLNRLITAAAFTNIEQDPNQTTFNQWGNTGTYNGRFYNYFTYDANGNILTQQRNDEDGNTFDQMTYQYAKDGGNTIANRLYHVNDNAATTHPNAPTPGKNHFDDDIKDMGLFNPTLAQINDGSNNYMYDPIGNLIADKQEEIHKINWTVYGKIKSIIRMASSLKKNLIFEYDANGNRIAKHQYGNMTPNSSTINFDPAIPTDWEKSTYYVRDAQGNVMAIYEYTIDDATQDNHYTLTERNIYGSSRLGNNNAPVEMIATTPPNPSQYSHHIGYRQYELSNHLGNVLAVISDRKIARDTDQDNTVDYYEPDVLLTYDYSPFGAPLHARSFTKEVCDEVTSTQKIEDLNTDFNDGTAQGWQALSGTTQLDASTGRLRVFKQGGGAGLLGVQQSITATSGYVYDFTITIENAFTSNSTVVLEIIDPNNTVIYTQSVGNGNPNPIVTFTHQFTASATGTYLIKVYRTGNQSNGSFYIDDALITHEEEVTQTLCEDFAGYRYGFNGHEKINKVQGASNVVDMGDRWLDVRLGRTPKPDVKANLYPGLSPYAYVANMPIIAIDQDGEKIYIVGGRKYRKEVKKLLKNLAKQSSYGRLLVTQAITSESVLVISALPGENIGVRSTTTDEAGNVKARLTFNLDKAGNPLDAANGTGDAELESPSEVTLGHELQHFIDKIHKVKHTQIINPDSPTYKDEEGNLQWNTISSSEVRAVEGENIIRAQMGLKLRTHYGGFNVFNKEVSLKMLNGFNVLKDKNNPLDFGEIGKNNVPLTGGADYQSLIETYWKHSFKETEGPSRNYGFGNSKVNSNGQEDPGSTEIEGY